MNGLLTAATGLSIGFLTHSLWSGNLRTLLIWIPVAWWITRLWIVEQDVEERNRNK